MTCNCTMLPKMPSHFPVCQFTEEDISQASAICLGHYGNKENQGQANWRMQHPAYL